MKKQYLGDTRDLFKYDLIQQILKGRSSLQKFTFIPMLTENESNSGDGNKRNFAKAKKDGRPGTNNEKLMEVLKKYKKMDVDKRDFTKIKRHFKSKGIEMLLYKDKRHEYFNHRTGDDEYFKNIPENLLHTPLVFVDPDIGLQIKNSTKKHLLYREVQCLYERMGKDSLLMIYQHFPRDPRKYKKYSPKGRSNRLEKELGNLPIYISDNEIMFFLLTRSDRLRSQLGRIIERYKRDHPKYKNLIVGNTNYSGT
jgi:hypothetical protein